MSSSHNLRRGLIGVLIAALVTGCSTTSPRDAVFRDDAVPMREIYHQAVTQGAPPARGRVSVSGQIDAGPDALAGWTREQANETRNLFPQGPNPTLLMYVFPHITADGTPVPGFTTPFKMYARDYFVLPGEVQP